MEISCENYYKEMEKETTRYENIFNVGCSHCGNLRNLKIITKKQLKIKRQNMNLENLNLEIKNKNSTGASPCVSTTE